MAQEYRPYSEARISIDQYKKYFEEVSQKHKATEQRYENQNLITFSDDSTKTSYAFTLENHPAYPAWITRVVRFKEGTLNLDQIGYFAGQEMEFAKLFNEYERLNESIRQKYRK